jgi:two-component system, LytTR family, response regulator
MLLDKTTLRLPTYFEQKYILINEIVRIEALSNYSKIHLLNGKYIVLAKVLRWFEDILPQELLVRVPHSYLININYISLY